MRSASPPAKRRPRVAIVARVAGDAERCGRRRRSSRRPRRRAPRLAARPAAVSSRRGARRSSPVWRSPPRECRMLEQPDAGTACWCGCRGSGKSRSAAERAGDRSVARLGRDDQLREQRIVVDADLVALDHTRVDADARARRLAIEQQRSRLRQESVRRILGVDAALDRVAALRRAPPASTAAARRPRPRSCARTRSTPVTASVTGCSTCSRVFISRK